MSEKKYKRFLENNKTRLVLVIVSALILIMISIVLFEDIDLDNTILVYNIFGTLALIGFLYSYSLTKKNIKNDLCVGITRKEIYKSYLRNIMICLVVSILLVIYYMVIYKLVINVNTSIFSLFDIEEILFLPLIFLALSFFGFFLGMVQMRKKIFYLLFLCTNTIIVVFVIYFNMEYYLDLILLGFVLTLLILNYRLIKKYDI